MAAQAPSLPVCRVKAQLGTVTLLLSLALEACTAGPPPPTATPVPASAAQPPVTITFWHTQTGAARDQLAALTGDFHKAYPWITVRGEAKNSEGDLLRQGIAAVALNQTPHFIIASPRTIADLARRDALVNLDLYMDEPNYGFKAADRADLLPGTLEAGRFPELDNQLFSFPFDTRGVVLFYNTAQLNGAKLDAAPHTWDEFAAAARATTKGTVKGWAMSPDAIVFYAMIFSQGGQVLNAKQNQVLLGGDPANKTLQMIATLSQSGAAYLVDSPAKARQDFAQAKSVFWFGTTSDVVALDEAIEAAGRGVKWGVANVPQGNPQKPTTAMTGSNIAVFKTALAQERAAWLFARWLATPEQAARWSRASMNLPSRLSARSLLVSNPPPSLPPTLSIDNVDTVPTGQGIPTAKDASNIDAAVVELWTSVANGNAPLAALNRAVSRISRVLGQAP